MRIMNKTSYLTRDLAAIIRRVAHEEFDQDHLRRIIVQVDYKRTNGRVCGRGTYGNGSYPAHWIQLLLERDPAKLDNVQLAHTTAHEFGHNKGVRHHDMTGPRYGYADGWRDVYTWAAEMPLRVKAEKPKPTVEAKTEAALLHAKDKVVCVQRRQKRLNTILRRWTRRVRYYERRLAALRIPLVKLDSLRSAP